MVRQQTTYQATQAVIGAWFLMLAVVVAYLTAALVCFVGAGYPINRTASMPVGIYRLTSKPITRGSILGACIPESFATLAKERRYLSAGSCSSGLRPVMKYVAAVPGDSVETREDGVSVNGSLLLRTRLLKSDALGRSIPNQIGRTTLRPGEYWLVSTHDRASFDSRYFGPVTETLGVVEPFITDSQLCRLSVIRWLLRC